MLPIDCYINEINEMLFAMYAHGGDSGGPYGSKSVWVKNSINLFLNKTGLNERYMYGEINKNNNNNRYFDVPQIVKRSKIWGTYDSETAKFLKKKYSIMHEMNEQF